MTYRPSITIMLLWFFWLLLGARTLGIAIWAVLTPGEPYQFFFDYQA